MITWMQKNNKWLIITVWISTISFVGAGFLGWGSYNYSNSSNSVASINGGDVSFEEFQLEYNNIYSRYKEILGDKFNDKMAKEFNIRKIAYDNTIQKNILLQYANSLGLNTLDDEIIKSLIDTEYFQENGTFSKSKYIEVLSNNRRKPFEYENILKKDILLRKIQDILNIKPTNVEIENFSNLIFLKDKIYIKILNSSNNEVFAKNEDVKKFWEDNQNVYMSDKSYKLKILKIKVPSTIPSNKEINTYFNENNYEFVKKDGKLKSKKEAREDIIKAINIRKTKRIAFKKYLKIKKNQEKIKNEELIYENELDFTDDIITKLKNLDNGKVLKPFLNKNKFFVIRLINKYEPKVLDYKMIKSSVKKDYELKLKRADIKDQAIKEFDNFKGKYIGYVSTDSYDKIIGLDNNEARTFLSQLFKVQAKKGYIQINEDKIVLYNIIDSKLGIYDSNNTNMVKNRLIQLENNILMNNLIDKLSKEYKIESKLNIEE